MGDPFKTSDRPRCSVCGFVMCEQFNDTIVNGITLSEPNGTYICYNHPNAQSTGDPLRPAYSTAAAFSAGLYTGLSAALGLLTAKAEQYRHRPAEHSTCTDLAAEVRALLPPNSSSEYICRCGLRVTPHRCKTDSEF